MGPSLQLLSQYFYTILRDGKLNDAFWQNMSGRRFVCFISNDFRFWNFLLFSEMLSSANSYFSILYKKWPLQTMSLYVLLIASRINFPILDFIDLLSKRDQVACIIWWSKFWNIIYGVILFLMYHSIFEIFVKLHIFKDPHSK